MNDSSKNNIAWQKLFDKYDILSRIDQEQQYIISSRQINEFREARLMTKFDHSFQLPLIFSENNLSILPISRGEYVISDIETFYKFSSNKNIEIIDIDIPAWVECIDYNNITSESTAINCAYISGIINDFIGEDYLLPTVSGRMSSSWFNFNVNRLNDQKLNVNVVNSQIEIDGGYEGVNSLCLIEAKNSISSDFLIRQLYYPYRLWNNKISKPVKNVFLVYSNGIFHLREYEFSSLTDYNSIRLIKEKKYRLREPDAVVINLETINSLLNKAVIIPEPFVPFPQANSFERVINLCEIIYDQDSKFITKEELSDNFDFTLKESFDTRQVNYYTDAAIYLGFIQKSKNEAGEIIFELTEQGLSLFRQKINERQISIISAIISHKVFKESLELYLRKAEIPSKDEIVSIMKNCNLLNIGKESTFYRRSSTIISWLNWIVGLIQE